MEIVIRNIQKSELKEAAKVFVEAFNAVGEMWNYETALARLESYFKPNFYFGAFDEDVMVGMVSTKIDHVTDHEELYIDIFAVLPNYQGRGIGKQILKKLEELAQEKQLRTIWLQSNTKLESNKFYLNNGFKDSHWVAIYKNL